MVEIYQYLFETLLIFESFVSIHVNLSAFVKMLNVKIVEKCCNFMIITIVSGSTELW